MAQTAEIFELPLDELGQLKQQLATLGRIRDQQREQLADVEGQLKFLRHRFDEQMRLNKGLHDSVRGLAEVRSLIRDGDSKEALFQLERVLSFLDSAWRVYA